MVNVPSILYYYLVIANGVLTGLQTGRQEEGAERRTQKRQALGQRVKQNEREEHVNEMPNTSVDRQRGGREEDWQTERQRSVGIKKKACMPELGHTRINTLHTRAEDHTH